MKTKTRKLAPAKNRKFDAVTPWAAVLDEIQRLQGEVSCDDHGMVTADAESLFGWVDDLEARLGYDVAALNHAMAEYIRLRDGDSVALAFARGDV